MDKKTRSERIYAKTAGETSELGIEVNPVTGEMRFLSQVEDVYSERSYERPKGPKVLSRIPQKSREVSFDNEDALAKEFDFFVAVDTNTKVINSQSISVSAMVPVFPVWVSETDGMTRAWNFEVPRCLEYVDLKCNPELFGWIAAIDRILERTEITSLTKIALVVDSDLGNIDKHNRREKKILELQTLPKNFTLVYATSDSGKESIANKALGVADSCASRCLEAALSGKLPPNDHTVSNRFFAAARELVTPELASSQWWK